jgi:hypothetical protein
MAETFLSERARAVADFLLLLKGGRCVVLEIDCKQSRASVRHP